MASKKHHKENKIYPNDMCFCNSGRKYKRCCMGKNNNKIDGQDLIITDQNILDEIRPYASSTGGNGSMMIKSVTFNGVTIEYENPVEVSSNDSEDSTLEGAAIFRLNENGKVVTSQIGPGRVKFGDVSEYGIGLKKKINQKLNDDWRLQIKIKTQEQQPKEYFDLILIRRNQERNHIDDPHITFRPDGSGKFIRIDKNLEIELITISECNTEGLVLPVTTKLKYHEFTILINYSYVASILYIDNVQIEY